MRTSTSILARRGRWIDPLNIRPEDIDFRSDVLALALKCRWCCRCDVHYSVAEHSVRVADYLTWWLGNPLTSLAGLLHDWAEAYLPDFGSPLKSKGVWIGGEDVRDIEHRIQGSVITWLHQEHGILLPPGYLSSAEIKLADRTLLATEFRDSMHAWGDEGVQEFGLPDPIVHDLNDPVQEEPYKIVPMPAAAAFQLFVERFEQLTARAKSPMMQEAKL